METMTIKDLDRGEKQGIAGLKRSVVPLASQLGIVREKVADIAPKIMRLFNQLNTKYETRLGGFVGFARLIDPSIPDRAGDNKDGEPGYRNHKVYYALAYMKRQYQTANRPRGEQGRRDPATDQLARTLLTVLQVVKDPDAIWKAVAQEFRFNARMIARVKARTENAKPLIDLSHVLKPVRIDEAKIIHMEPVNTRRTGTTVPAEEPAATAVGNVTRGRRRAA